MNDVDILIPHRSDGGAHRDTNLAWVQGQWRTHFPDWPVHVGTHTEGPWDKAAAVADALARSSARMIIVTDNDVWVHRPRDITRAVEATARTGWAMPHNRVFRLNAAHTRAYQDDPTLPPGKLRLVRSSYRGVMTGGIFVIDRQVYLDHGGLDPRFLGHTGQDLSFGYALQTLVGNPWRGTAELVHLYHPPNPARHDESLQKTNRALFDRYSRARHHPITMRKIIQETREQLSALLEAPHTG